MIDPGFPEEITRLLFDHDFGVLATYSGETPCTSLISIDFSSDGHFLFFPTHRDTCPGTFLEVPLCDCSVSNHTGLLRTTSIFIQYHVIKKTVIQKGHIDA